MSTPCFIYSLAQQAQLSSLTLLNPSRTPKKSTCHPNILMASLSVMLFLAFLEKEGETFHTSMKHMIVDCALCNWRLEAILATILQAFTTSMREKWGRSRRGRRLLKSFGIVDVVVVLEDRCVYPSFLIDFGGFQKWWCGAIRECVWLLWSFALMSKTHDIKEGYVTIRSEIYIENICFLRFRDIREGVTLRRLILGCIIFLSKIHGRLRASLHCGPRSCPRVM